jgi:hypothetical protein
MMTITVSHELTRMASTTNPSAFMQVKGMKSQKTSRSGDTLTTGDIKRLRDALAACDKAQGTRPMTDNTLVVHLTRRDNDITLPSELLAILLGVPLEECQHLEPQSITYGSYDAFPSKLAKDGKRRAREAYAHTGDENVWSAIGYWAAKEYGLTVKITIDDERSNQDQGGDRV